MLDKVIHLTKKTSKMLNNHTARQNARNQAGTCETMKSDEQYSRRNKKPATLTHAPLGGGDSARSRILLVSQKRRNKDAKLPVSYPALIL